MSDMQQYTKIKQKMPNKRSITARKEDFNEIYNRFSDNGRNKSLDNNSSTGQASRCTQCGIPYCQINCPLHNNIPDWLFLTANGRIQEAYELMEQTNSFPEICGKICPQDRLCEGGCVIGVSGHNSITIGAIEAHITNIAWEKGWVKPMKPLAKINKSIGIIGMGPAGLAAAGKLRNYGYNVEIYDRYKRSGGLMTYGIPSFKLEKETIFRRERLLTEAGVKFHFNTDIGADISFDEFRNKHDAIFVANGFYKNREIDIKGSDSNNIIQAFPYLITQNKRDLKDEISQNDDELYNAKGKDVVVIGGGDTAMDCVRTAIRQKANSVKCLYRRDKDNMPGSIREFNNSIEEGAEFIWLVSPIEFLNDENSNVSGIKVQNMRLGLEDSSGRRTPKPIKDSIDEYKTDLVILALGSNAENIKDIWQLPKLELSQWGTIIVDDNKMTNIDGVFAGGDIMRGSSLVVWAIDDGHKAAIGINEYLNKQV